MAASKKFIMVSGADESVAGATVWWRLLGDVDRQKLLDALTARGFGPERCPDPVEPETALRRAVGELRGKRRLVRPIKRGVWAVVDESVDLSAEELKHYEGPKVRLDKIGRAELENATPDEAELVKRSYGRYLDALTTEDVASWLIHQAQRLGAVSLREHGGIYYLPPSRWPEWSGITDALQSAHPRHACYSMPTFKLSAGGARAILDSLTAEVEADVDAIQDDVLSGDLGVRALETRGEKGRLLLAKVEEYEALVGERLEKLRAAVAQVQVDVAAAKLAAEAAREDAP
ncbi:MAG TPA: hypothetical protein VES97_06050 [Solirubrobacteraceae bacterium]|nr:hypothetical protein [Solirubrobacteraceae bacterium]